MTAGQPLTDPFDRAPRQLFVEPLPVISGYEAASQLAVTSGS